jgi:hypothetical protein
MSEEVNENGEEQDPVFRTIPIPPEELRIGDESYVLMNEGEEIFDIETRNETTTLSPQPSRPMDANRLREMIESINDRTEELTERRLFGQHNNHIPWINGPEFVPRHHEVRSLPEVDIDDENPQVNVAPWVHWMRHDGDTVQIGYDGTSDNVGTIRLQPDGDQRIERLEIYDDIAAQQVIFCRCSDYPDVVLKDDKHVCVQCNHQVKPN